MNLIKDEEWKIDGNTITFTYKCAGDIGYIKEMQYIKYQSIIDRIGNSK